MNFEEIFARRSSLSPGEIKPGLERVSAALNHLRRSEGLKTVPCVLVGGTNGKGGTAGHLWRILQANGVHAGLYTSPHLVSYAERFFVGYDDPILEPNLVEWLDDLQSRLPVDLMSALTFFEISTLIALWGFAKCGTELNILEVGLGGRLDSTNCVDPILSVIVSVDVDHIQWLGSDLEQIAREKAGIMRNGITTVCGANQKPKVETALREIALRVGARLVAAPNREADYWDGNLELARLAGAELARQLPALGIDPAVCLDEAVLPPCQRARFEVFTIEGTPVLFDVCHNPAGAKAFVSAMKRRGIDSGVGLVTVMEDKDYEGILGELSSCLDPIITFSTGHSRSRSEAVMFSSFKEAFASARTLAAGRRLFLCGSVIGLGGILEDLGVRLLSPPNLFSDQT